MLDPVDFQGTDAKVDNALRTLGTIGTIRPASMNKPDTKVESSYLASATMRNSKDGTLIKEIEMKVTDKTDVVSTKKDADAILGIKKARRGMEYIENLLLSKAQILAACTALSAYLSKKKGLREAMIDAGEWICLFLSCANLLKKSGMFTEAKLVSDMMNFISEKLILSYSSSPDDVLFFYVSRKIFKILPTTNQNFTLFGYLKERRFLDSLFSDFKVVNLERNQLNQHLKDLLFHLKRCWCFAKLSIHAPEGIGYLAVREYVITFTSTCLNDLMNEETLDLACLAGLAYLLTQITLCDSDYGFHGVEEDSSDSILKSLLTICSVEDLFIASNLFSQILFVMRLNGYDTFMYKSRLDFLMVSSDTCCALLESEFGYKSFFHAHTMIILATCAMIESNYALGSLSSHEEKSQTLCSISDFSRQELTKLGRNLNLYNISIDFSSFLELYNYGTFLSSEVITFAHLLCIFSSDNSLLNSFFYVPSYVFHYLLCKNIEDFDNHLPVSFSSKKVRIFAVHSK